MRQAKWCIVLLTLLWIPGQTKADVAVLLEEPYGYDGAFGGVGHTAVYLNRVCAASLFSLRRCEVGEYGVVISRYNRIGGHDWIGIPLVPYLYAVSKPEDVPAYAGGEIVDSLRDQYRRIYLQELAPDDAAGQAPGRRSWVQLVGSAYNRTSFTYELERRPTRTTS